MSVSIFARKDFITLYHSLLSDSFFSTVEKSLENCPSFNLKFNSYFRDDTKKWEKEPYAKEFTIKFLNWMCENLRIGNIFAFITQYPKEWKVAKEVKEYLEKTEVSNNEILSKNELINLMGSINYNLYNNAGNSYIEPVYRQAFESIYKSLKNENK